MRIELVREMNNAKIKKRERIKKDISNEIIAKEIKNEKYIESKDASRRLNAIRRSEQVKKEFKAKERLEDIKEDIVRDEKSLKIMNSVKEIRNKVLDSLS